MIPDISKPSRWEKVKDYGLRFAVFFALLELIRLWLGAA